MEDPAAGRRGGAGLAGDRGRLTRMAAERDTWWDRWKGIAILAVVAIHALGATDGAPPGSWQHAFGLVARQFLNFAVPLFLALAGYFAGRGFHGAALPYWRARAARILPPYLLWTAVFVAIRAPEHVHAPRALVEDFLFGRGIGIGYFVIVLLQCVVLVPWLARLRGTRQHVAVMLLGTVAGLALGYTVRAGHPETMAARFPYYCLPFIAWYPFFHLGFWAGRSPAPATNHAARWKAGAAVAVLLAVGEAFAWSAFGLDELAASQIKASSFAASLLVALHVLRAPPQRARRATVAARGLVWLGRNSYALYLMHMLPLRWGADAVRQHMAWLLDWRPLAVLLLVAGTVLACCACVALVRALAPAVAQRPLLGAG